MKIKIIEQYENIICKLLQKRNIKNYKSIFRELFWIIYDNNLSINDIKYFIFYINNNEFIFEQGNLWLKIEEYFKNDKYVKFMKDIFNLTPCSLNKTPNSMCGKGELLYLLLRKKSIQAKKSDINDCGSIIELKGNLPRIMSTNITGIQYKNMMIKYLNGYINGNIVGSGGLKGSVVFEIEKYKCKKHYIKEFKTHSREENMLIFEKIFKYLNININKINKIFDDNNNFLQDKFNRILLEKFYKEYKLIYKFDKIIIFGDGSNVKILSNIKSLRQISIDKDYFRINQPALIGWYIK